MNVVSQEEIAASVIQPHFDAVRDVFASYRCDGKLVMPKIAKVKFIVDEEMHDKPRHFAGTREDGLFMVFAPQIIDLEQETLVAILAHEFGHASDFLYAARWLSRDRDTCLWIEEEDVDSKPFREWQKIWRHRSKDQIEWSADAIAMQVTGQTIRYTCQLQGEADCLLQTFGNGIHRPKGLR